ncbi:uncharacterized protein LOC121973270 [Zingiber officinale]|uniref:uncharacterized protein LOC121973270 n=1 Tax=Zingiber officinale TaxID=94328 RepID=UPI001C4CA6EB|nr:uncharacterized protein LOC121973270 [Zingiber officinale]
MLTLGMKPNFLILLLNLLFLLVSQSSAASDDRHGNSAQVQQPPQFSFHGKPLQELNDIVNASNDEEKMDLESRKWDNYLRKSNSGAGGSQSIHQPHPTKSNAVMFTPYSYVLRFGFLYLAFFLA